MSIQVLFFLFVAILISGFIVAIVNMAKAVSGFAKAEMDVPSTFKKHLVAMVLCFIGGLGTLGFGIAWLVQVFKP